MTSGPTPSVVAAVLRQSRYPLIAFDLDDLIILGANEAACELLGRAPDSLDGVPVFEILSPGDQPNVEAARSQLTGGVIQGYRALRHFRKADGTEFEANVWVRLTTTDAGRFGLAIIERGVAAVPWPLFDASITIAGIVTDHDWTIELVSSDIEEILGRSPEDFKGSSLLGLFQAADVQNFLSAVARVADESKATLRMHFRDGDANWREVWCMVVAMCQHSPPRLGLAIAAISEFGLDLSSELHRQLAVLGGGVLDGMDQLRPNMPSGNFSTRQWEILNRLLRGERVDEIAADLYVSPSTVRNHLAAIYKKFGVHSQTQLLAKLLRPPDRLM
jgi:PAS domain S-box-containing protein